MAFLTKDQVRTILQAAPPGADPKLIIQGLIERGNSLEGHPTHGGLAQSVSKFIAPEVKQLEALPPEQRPAAVKQMGEQGQQMLEDAKPITQKIGERLTDVGKTIQETSAAGIERVMQAGEELSQAQGIRESGQALLKGAAGALESTVGAAGAGLAATIAPEVISGIKSIGTHFKDALKNRLVEEGMTPEEAQANVDQQIQNAAAGLSQTIVEPARRFIEENPEAALIPEIGSYFIGAAGAKAAAPVVAKGTKAVGQAVAKGAEAVSNLRNVLRTSSKPADEILASLNKNVIGVAEAEQLAKEFGVTLPAASVASPIKAKTEGILAEGLFGGGLKARADKAVEDFSKSIDAIAAKAPQRGELGEEIVNKFATVEKQRKSLIDTLYNRADEIIKQKGGEIKVLPEKSATLLKDLINRKQQIFEGVGDSATVTQLKNILSGTKGAIKKTTSPILGVSGQPIMKITRIEPTLTNFKESLKVIGDKANFESFAPTTDEKNFRALYRAMKSDIDNAVARNAPELAATLKVANRKFAEFEDLKQRPFAKSIKKLGEAGDVDVLAEKLTKTKVSTNEIKQLYETLGKETTTRIQNRIIADIIEGAKSATGGFTPTGFTKQLRSIGKERLEVLLTPAQNKLLQKIDTVNQLIAKGTAITRGSQTAPIQQLTGALKGVAALGTGGLSLIGEWITAAWLNSARGQMFLKGVSPKELSLFKQAVESIKSTKGSVTTAPINKLGEKMGLIKKGEGAIPTQLLQEAKKYKSAEEFVRSQGKPIYHGTDSSSFNPVDFNIKKAKKGETFFNPLGEGLYASSSKDFVKRFGKNTEEFILPPSAKVKKISIDTWEKDFPTISRQSLKNLGIKYDDLTFNEKLEINRLVPNTPIEAANNFEVILGNIAQRVGKKGSVQGAIQKSVMDKYKNYDILHYLDTDYAFGADEIVVKNPSILKTKSQLTDIWNKAHSK